MATKYSAGGAVEANTIPTRIDMIQGFADEIVAAETKTQSMVPDARLVAAFGNAGEVKVKTIDFTDADLEAMGTDGQYPLGSAKVTWASYTLANDEGKAFDIGWTDATKGGIEGDIAYDIAEYTRQKVIPRIDTVRLAKLGSVGYVSGTRGATGAALTKANIYSSIMTGLKSIGNAYGVDEGCTIYLPYSSADLLDTSTEISATKDVKGSGKAIISRVDDINGNSIVRVPDKYMTGYAFAIHAPNTVMGIATTRIKHVPAANNTRGDGEFIGFHIYHDAIILNNKADGTYAYKTTTSTG